MSQINNSARPISAPMAMEDQIWSKLPMELVQEIAISSVVSSEPFEVIWSRKIDHLNIRNISDVNLTMMRIDKSLHQLCDRAFLSENIWAFDIAGAYSYRSQGFEAFHAFTRSFDKNKTRLIKRLMFTGNGALFYSAAVRSMARSYKGLTEIILQPWTSETREMTSEIREIMILNFRILFSWFRNLQVISVDGHLERGQIRHMTMETSRTVYLRDPEEAIVIREE